MAEEQAYKPKDESIKIPMDRELADRLIEIEKRRMEQDEALRQRSLIALALLVVGSLVFAVSVGALFHNYWLSAATMGVAMVILGAVLGKDG